VRDSGSTQLHKAFPGGHLTMVGANSGASLASRPIRIFLGDEVDRYPLSAGIEGDPVNLAKKRTTTFWNKLTILTSTPTVEGVSRIDMEFEESDKRYYYVPCPHCEFMQRLVWAGVKWDKDKPDTAQYACEHCGAMFGDNYRRAAIKKGEWRATEVFKGRAGFHLSELYSPWSSMVDIVTNFLEAKKSQDTLKTWVNTSLGECWREDEGEKIEWETLYNRREHYPPELDTRIRVVTAGVDVQDTYVEGELIGWGAAEENWGLTHFRLVGDPGKPELWKRLTTKLKQIYRRDDGVDLHVKMVAIDSGGHYTDEVYAWCRQVGASWAIPIKGSSLAGKPVAQFPRKRNRQKVYLTTVGTDTCKEIVYGRYRNQEEGPGWSHWPRNEEYDEEYFMQATTETKKKLFRHGVPYFQWDAGSRRNEVTDIRNYNLVALRILTQHFGLKLGEWRPKVENFVENNDTEHVEPTPLKKSRAKPRRKPGSWVDGGGGTWL
jgi:phage terminase large subunit GpA-like protein